MGTQSGNVSVCAESGCGNSAYIVLPKTIGIPAQPDTIFGNYYPECNSTNTYSIDAVNGATSYDWEVPVDATIVSGQGTTSIVVNFGVTPGNIYVLSQNTCGSSSYTYLIIVEFFTCGDQYTDPQDNLVYNTVSIGSQCWFAENINIGTHIERNQEMTDNNIYEKYCYDDDPAYCETYGGLYQWDK
jgi:hypothetical protein